MSDPTATANVILQGARPSGPFTINGQTYFAPGMLPHVEFHQDPDTGHEWTWPPLPDLIARRWLIHVETPEEQP